MFLGESVKIPGSSFMEKFILTCQNYVTFTDNAVYSSSRTIRYR